MRPRVIVLEDDADTREALCRLLSRQNYEVIGAADPTICPVFGSLDGTCPHDDACGDFLLTDNRMPSMTGLQFVARQSERGCKGVVHNKAVISGSWSERERRDAEQLGCRLFSKPYRLDDILSWIEQRKEMIPADRKLTDLGSL